MIAQQPQCAPAPLLILLGLLAAEKIDKMVPSEQESMQSRIEHPDDRGSEASELSSPNWLFPLPQENGAHMHVIVKFHPHLHTDFFLQQACSDF